MDMDLLGRLTQAIRMARKSLTLVSVGPVRSGRRARRTSRGCHAPASMRARVEALRRGRAPACRARACAPATSSVPSMPSVSPASAQMPGAPSSATREAEQELGVAAAAAGRAVADRDRGLAARQQHGGRPAAARRARGRERAMPAMHDAHLARLAFQRVAQDERRQAEAARGLGRRRAAPSSAWRSGGNRCAAGCRASAFRRRPAPAARRRPARA